MQHEQNAAAAAKSSHEGLGHVIACRGSEIRVELSAALSHEAVRPTVGKFVVIRTGASRLVGVIVEVCATADEPHSAIARVNPMGEISGLSGGVHRFKRGVRDYPAIGDEVLVLTSHDLRLIYSSVAARSISIGHLHQDDSVLASLDADSLVAKHFAVLGSTGVGKSTGIAVLVSEIMNTQPNLRVLLLDLHNEYGHSFGAEASVLGGQDLKLPFWLFNFEEFTDVIYGGKPAVPEEVEILAELIPAAKGLYLSHKSGSERSILVRRSSRHSGFSPDTPSPYLIQDLLSLIDERMGKLENRSTRMFYNRLMTRIDGIRSDPRYGFMFENANVGGDTMAAVLIQLFRLDTDHGITVLRLASLPSEVVDAVVCVACRLAFEFGLWSDGGMPLLLVCEEAHRYASVDHETGFAPVRRALSKIAKEGRKYGVHLGLVTQRPAELDPKIISQCSTLFLMRMTNEQDQALLQSAVSDVATNLLPLVPSLGTGEFIGVGEGMPLPARVVFKKLPHQLVPCSEQRSDGAENLNRAELVRKTIERWRRATTSQARTEEITSDPHLPDKLQPPEGASALSLRAAALERKAAGAEVCIAERYSIPER